MKESTIQKQVVDYLSKTAHKNNFFFFSIPNEAFMQTAMIAKMDGKTKAMLATHLKKMGMVPGVPDLCILYEGFSVETAWEEARTLFIELKTPTGKVSPVQKIVHESIKRVGHDVEIARGLDEVIFILRNYGVLG